MPDVLIRHNFQKGLTVYLNLSPIKYWNSQTRLSEYGKNWRRIISRILDSAGLKPRVRVHVKGSSAMVESLFWKNGKNIYLGIIANPSNNFEAIKNGKATMITLLFNKMVHLKNLRTQIQFQRKKIFQDKFLPWEGNVYQVTF